MSKTAIEGIKPEILWQRFYELSQVPRPSKKEEKVLNFLKKYFNDNNISFKQDKTGNLLAEIPATKGNENSPVVVLQAHVDMVCEKNKGIEHDFDNDPIKLLRQNGWIKADGTTLGSDNGIGVAAALAFISDKDSVHGPLEILLTVDEETGLTGANYLDASIISGRIMLNLDSEEDGAFYIGCSGGIDTVGTFNIKYDENKKYDNNLLLRVKGLLGGHSGLEIDRGRGNSIKILARALSQLKGVDFGISFIEGGSKRNAIPRESEAVIHFNSADENNIKEIISAFNNAIKNELKSSDAKVEVILENNNSNSGNVFAEDFKNVIINTILALPHGILAMSFDVKGLVETSTNLATVVQKENKLIIGTSQRSSIKSAIEYASDTNKAIFRLSGAEISQGDGYPGWKPNINSKLLKLSTETFKELFNKEPEIKAIHAGLECGILLDKIPGADVISFGPTIQGAHSPDERIEIETVERFYDLLKSILKKIAEGKY